MYSNKMAARIVLAMGLHCLNRPVMSKYGVVHDEKGFIDGLANVKEKT